MGIGYEYELSNHAHRGHDVTANPKEEITEFSTINFRASYAISPRVRLHGTVPLRSILAPKTDLNSGDRYLRDFSGVGDILASATLLLHASPAPDQTIIAFTGGLRLPTGDSNPNHDWGYGNSRDPVLQPGYGTVDPLIGLSAARKLGRLGVNASAVTRLSGGTNVHGYRYADEYQGTVGLTGSVSSWLDAALSGAVITSNHDFDNGSMVQNTGGLWGYLIPQLTIKSPGVQLQPSVQIPVYSFVNGGQLVSDAVYSVGVSFRVGRDAIGAPSQWGHSEMSRLERPSNLRSAAGCSRCGISNIVQPETLTLIEIMSETCGACQDLEPRLVSFANLHPELAIRQVDLFSLSKEQVQELGITETPTLLLYAPDGSLLERVTDANLYTFDRHLK